MTDIVWSPTDFVAVLNQTLEFAYPFITIEGELSNFRVSRNKWVYFDIKDVTASIKCFATVYSLPGPLEDGMMVRLSAQPRLHPLYNFCLNVQTIVPVGDGSLKKAADLLQTKLEKEGLFDESRKRPIPFAPQHIGLVTSKQSAAYGDFIKILDARWGGVKVTLVDVQVQGDKAANDIVVAVDRLNQLGEAPEVLIITRGGGSIEDLAVFNSEQVTRAVAASRIPTLVAIGHEIDFSLAELAADQRASTPSNAAELLVPDKKEVKTNLIRLRSGMVNLLKGRLKQSEIELKNQRRQIVDSIKNLLASQGSELINRKSLLEALNPAAALKRGYAVIKSEGHIIRSVKSLKIGQSVNLLLHDGSARAQISEVE